ncbi:hypothetical protein J4223_02270 [Candidatus Woesearchaeota archaeon]|nr:hypothetical protein [Candidatus Woesearchaeota archaeon]
MFNKSEIRALIISIIVISFAIGFDDKSPVFVLGHWIQNFIAVMLMVTVSFVVHQLGHKLVARANGFETEYNLWGVQSFKLTTKSLMGRTINKPFPKVIRIFGKQLTINAFPIGAVISVLTTLISNGKVFFLAIGQYNLLVKKATRVGRKYIEVTNVEEAKIALAGPIASIILMVIAKWFNIYGTLDTFILLNAALALFHMIPLPNLAGIKIYFGSRILYVTSLVFIISMVVLVYTVSTIPMLIISGVSAIIAFLLYYYYRYFN